MKVSVLGAGNAGCSLAFHLAQLGHEVTLYENERFAQSVALIGETLEIKAEKEVDGFEAVIHGKARVCAVTTDIETAVNYGEVLIVIVPAFGQETMFKAAMPFLKSEQIVISMPGNFGSIQYAKWLREAGLEIRPYFVDTDSIPYACRKTGGNTVFITGIKKLLHVGVYPSVATDAIFAKIQPLFTLALEKCENVLETGFYNMNMVVHPPPVVFNAGWIEATGGKFSFYNDGCTPAICRAIDALDNDRMAIAKALGIKTMNFVQTDQSWYGDSGQYTTHGHLQAGEFHSYFPAPASLNNRYIDEDICYSLLPIARKLADKFKIPTPFIDKFVNMAEVITGKELKPQRDFDSIVKDGDSVEQLHENMKNWKN